MSVGCEWWYLRRTTLDGDEDRVRWGFAASDSRPREARLGFELCSVGLPTQR